MSDVIRNEGDGQVFIPGHFVPKAIYLGLSLIVFAIAVWFAWEPLSRMWFGETTTARVSEIHVNEPGQPKRIHRYRIAYEPHKNFRVTYEHYVTINIDGRPELFRISADARRKPPDGLFVNDRVEVAYFPDDPARLAFAYGQIRTWGAAALFGALGLSMLATSIPLLWAVGKPIAIDPEAPETESIDDEEAAEADSAENSAEAEAGEEADDSDSGGQKPQA